MRHPTCRSFLLVLFFLVPATTGVAAGQEEPPAPAQQQSLEARKPWEWTLEERLERRFDPEDMDRRLAAAEARAKRPVPEPGTIISSVDGREDPELLLPVEVFDRLLRLGYVLTSNPENREVWRMGFAQGAVALGLGADFLSELEKVAAEGIRAYKEQRAHKEASVEATHWEHRRMDAEAKSRHQAFCAAQARSLTAARARFGRALFDRYLYEVVAPDMGRTTDGFKAEDSLRWREAGCP